MAWLFYRGGFIKRNNSDMATYTGTVTLAAGANTAKTTTITQSKTIYSVEYIDASGNVITGELGTPVISVSGNYYVITVYSTNLYTNANLRIMFI